MQWVKVGKFSFQYILEAFSPAGVEKRLCRFFKCPQPQVFGSRRAMFQFVGNTHSSTHCRPCSQRSGGPGSPTGKLPRRLDRTGPQFLLSPALGHFRTAGLSKDHRSLKVRHYYSVLIKAPQGTVVDCRSPDKDGGDLEVFLHR